MVSPSTLTAALGVDVYVAGMLEHRAEREDRGWRRCSGNADRQTVTMTFPLA